MEYILIFILQILGIGFHVMQSVQGLGNKFPNETPKSIFRIFWKSDWDSIAISVLVLAFHLVGHYAVHDYAPSSISGYQYFELISFGLAIVLGYAGQGLIYKVLGKASAALEQRVNDKLS